jgi:hypothetical protein
MSGLNNLFLTARNITPSVPITGNTPYITAAMRAEGEYHDTEAALYSERIKSRIKPTVSFRMRNFSCFKI